MKDLFHKQLRAGVIPEAQWYRVVRLKVVSIMKRPFWPWLVWLRGMSTGLQTKGLPVWLPVRAHAWVAGQVPGWGHVRGNHTVMCLSLSLSLLFPLSKNK